LGRDLRQVRLHTDNLAAASADAIQAQAYTVGRDVVFARDAYRPHTAAGQSLLAHELVHVAQGDGGPLTPHLTIGSAHSPLEREASAASEALLTGPTASQPAVTPAAGGVVARQPAPPAVATAGGGTNFVQLISGRYVGDLEGADANVREDVLFVLGNLNRLWSIPNDVYAAEQATVAARPADSRLSAASIPTTIAALRRNEDPSINDQVALALLGVTLSASVSNSRSNARADIYALQDALHANWNMTSSEYTADRARVNAGPDPVNNADIAATFRGLARFKAAFVGGTSRRNGPLSGTAPPTAQQTASRNAALITPGTATTTTTVGGVTTTTRQGFKDTVKVGGVNRTYRQDLWAEMDAVVKWMHKQASDMFARPRIGGGAAGDVSAFEPIGDAAKQQVDAIYGVSRQFGPRFHSGVNLRDASQRAGDAVDMIRYLVDNQEELGVVRARHNADHSPGRPERAIAETFKTDYVAHGSNRARLVLVDHNEFAQAVAGADEAEILEVIDHHRLSGNLRTKEPIRFLNEPVGSTSTIVGIMYRMGGAAPDKGTSICLCAGIISDTLHLTSPTTTNTDREILEWLSGIAGVDCAQFVKDFFAAGSMLREQTPERALESDRKVFEENGWHISISQIEELGLDELWKRETDLHRALEALLKKHGLHFACLMVTDITRHHSVLLVAGDKRIIEQVDTDHAAVRENVFDLPGVVSRKKQLFPYMSHVVTKLSPPA